MTSAALLRFATGKTNFEERLGPPQCLDLDRPILRWASLFGHQLFGADVIFGRLRHGTQHWPRFGPNQRTGSSCGDN